MPASGTGRLRRRAAGSAADRTDRADPGRQVDRAGRDAPSRRRAADVRRPSPRGWRRSGCRRRPSSTSARRRRPCDAGWRRSRPPSWAIGGRTPAGTGSRPSGASTAPGSGGPPRPPPRSTRMPCSTRSPTGVTDAERAGLPRSGRSSCHSPTSRRGSGGRKATGLTGALLAEAVEPPRPPTRVVVVPDGDAEGARGEPVPPRRRTLGAAAPQPGNAPTIGRRDHARPARCGSRCRGGQGVAGPDRRGRGAPPGRARGADGCASTRGDRPDPHGQGARRPQGECGIPRRPRGAVVPRGPRPGPRGAAPQRRHRRCPDRRRRGSASVRRSPSSTTARRPCTRSSAPRNRIRPSGRISSSSPVGRALVGHDVGDEVLVRTPAGERAYVIVAID